MNPALIDPFVISTCDVFKKMLACELSRGRPAVKRSTAPTFEISGVIEISGRAEGTVVVSLDPELAIRVAREFLGELPERVDENVIDSVGELTNIVAGGAKARLEGWDLAIGLPSVICGKNHTVNFPASEAPVAIPFHCSCGRIAIEVGLVENETAGAN